MSKKDDIFGPYDDDFDSAFDSVSGKRESNFKYAPSCHESHPVLMFGNAKVYGGSCSRPQPGYDVYVGVDSYMKRQNQVYPWNVAKGGPIEVSFEISDQCAPKNPAEFKKMIDWLMQQLAEGKDVHVGCIGGHGRTGMVLAALVKTIKGEHDAITWVRANYCKKAVESTSQVNFLVKHFGIKEVAGAKSSHDQSAWTYPRGSYHNNKQSAYNEYQVGGPIIDPRTGHRLGAALGADSARKDLPIPKSKQVVTSARAVKGKNAIW